MAPIRFGGIPSVLPDIQRFVVIDNAWPTNPDFANLFGLAQTIPGPNMILMMALIGPAAAAQRRRRPARCISSVIACGTGFATHPFRDAPWQKIVRAGLVPLTFGLIVAGVMARTIDRDWTAVGITAATAALLLTTRINRYGCVPPRASRVVLSVQSRLARHPKYPDAAPSR